MIETQKPFLVSTSIAIFISLYTIMPPYNFKTKRFIYLSCFKWYAISALMIVIIMSGLSLIRRHEIFLTFVPSTLLMWLDMSTEIIGITNIIIFNMNSTLLKTKQWYKLFTKLGKIYVPLPQKYSSGCFIVVTITLLIIYITFTLTYGLVSIYYFSYSLFYYAQFLLAFIIYSITKPVRYRYFLLQTTLKHLQQISCLKDRLETLKTAEKVYLELNDIIENFNDIFGWPIFGLMFNFGVMLITTLALSTTATEINITVFYLLVTVATSIWPLVITFSCDLTTKEAQKIPQRCLKMEKKLIVTPEELAALRSFENRALVHVPKFTAAGFFEINRVTLLTFISNLATYFVVLMQLNSMFNK
uniref:Gustatory receptor n=1 Tax=Diabrotica virgifera virgifera TaxID=50390 RepID=A0A6P7F9U5_DIAVI